MLISGFALFLAYSAILIYSNSLLNRLDRNHFRNSFPYNFYKDASLPSRIVMYSLFGLSMLMTVVGLAFFFVSFQTSFMWILGIVLPLSYLFLGISNILPLSYYRSHILFSALAFLIFTSFCSLFAFVKIIPNALIDDSELALWVCIPIGIIGMISFFGVIFNPKLRNWAKMDKVEEDGKTYYIKPKINYYALYEWICLLEMEFVALMLFFNIIATGAIEIA